MMRNTALSGLALAAALALTGCGGTESGTGSPAPESSPAAISSPGSASSADEISHEHDDADVMFAQMMIPHHEQAVEMSETLLAKEDIPAEVGDFAQQVIDAQGPEVQHMNSMLKAWGAEPEENMGHGNEGGIMSGMMRQEDMQQLKASQGTEAARLYLKQMTAHHEGAVKMAEDHLDAGRNRQVQELAQEVIDAQEAEIEEMRTMLDGL